MERNARLLAQANNIILGEKKKDRPLIIGPLRQDANVGAAMLGAFTTQAMEGVPKYRGVRSTVLCYLKNPANQNHTKVRVLLESGAEISMIDSLLP